MGKQSGVRSICVPVSNPIGMMQGMMVTDHRVPDGFVVVTMRFCQNCGRVMTVRPSQKYCIPCCAKYLLPVDFSYFLEGAPPHTRLERDLPHYDKVQ